MADFSEDLLLVSLLLTFGPPEFKFLPQNFLYVLTSGFSYGALEFLILVSDPVSLTLFWLPSLVRARAPTDA